MLHMAGRPGVGVGRDAGAGPCMGRGSGRARQWLTHAGPIHLCRQRQASRLGSPHQQRHNIPAAFKAGQGRFGAAARVCIHGQREYSQLRGHLHTACAAHARRPWAGSLGSEFLSTAPPPPACCRALRAAPHLKRCMLAGGPPCGISSSIHPGTLVCTRARARGTAAAQQQKKHMPAQQHTSAHQHSSTHQYITSPVRVGRQ